MHGDGRFIYDNLHPGIFLYLWGTHQQNVLWLNAQFDKEELIQWTVNLEIFLNKLEKNGQAHPNR